MIHIKSDNEEDILLWHNVNIYVDDKKWCQVIDIKFNIKAGEPVIAEITAVLDGEIDISIPEDQIKIHRVIYTNRFWEMLKYRIKRMLRK